LEHLAAVLLLALVQGLSEFLPISSSGHLVVVQHLLGFNEYVLLYDVVFHLGTLAAVLVYFFPDIRSLLTPSRLPENSLLWCMLLTATLPTALIGFFMRHWIEELFSAPAAVGFALLLTALFLIASRFLRLPEIHPMLAALFIGIAQGVAIIPGISRSGITISLALILSLNQAFAFRFSFLLSIPAIGGAFLLQLPELAAARGHLLFFLLGAIAAAFFGYLALALLRRLVEKGKMHLFAYYCLPLGLLIIFLLK